MVLSMIDILGWSLNVLVYWLMDVIDLWILIDSMIGRLQNWLTMHVQYLQTDQFKTIIGYLTEAI